MKWSEWIEKWKMTSLKINAGFLEMQWAPKKEDKKAAWELYIELLTRLSKNIKDLNSGEEKKEVEIINAINSLFPIIRQVIKDNGSGCTEFTKISILVMNQIIRPFSAKWSNKLILEINYDKVLIDQFYNELSVLLSHLNLFLLMLADMSELEQDLTLLEE